MSRSYLNSSRAFMSTLALTAIVALLKPTALGWTRVFAELEGLVLTPFTIVGNSISSWLRPPPISNVLIGADADLVVRLERDAQESRQLYLAEQAKVESLQWQLEQLQKVAPLLSKTPIQPLVASIGLRSPNAAQGLVTLNRGANHGVRPGTIAVYEGVNLLGRVTDDVSAVQCTLMPLTNKSIGLIEARVLQRGDRKYTPTTEKSILLEPDGKGAFVAQVESNHAVINIGDYVVLHDAAAWPASAEAMTIGTVESVRPNDMEPLRNTIIVRPAYQVSQVKLVILKIEPDEDQSSATTSEPKR